MNMTDCVARLRFELAVAAAALSLITAAHAVELDPKAVVYKTGLRRKMLWLSASRADRRMPRGEPL
jgi:hypothetical protein